MTGFNTLDRARGRWREILPALGIASQYLINRHGPCPLCGGKDRFRFDDKEGSGSYICGQCGAGNGLILLRKKHGWDFKTAADEIDKIIGTDAPVAPVTIKTDPDERRRSNLERTLSEATDRGLVERYLRGRGLSIFPNILRGHPALAYAEEGQFIGKYPAVLAPVTGPDGMLQSAHRVYLGNMAGRKKMMPVVDTISGAAIRLFQATDELGVAEGFETAIAAHELFNVPTWALVSTAGMDKWQPPEGVTRVVVFGDNDVTFAGQASAYGLAHRLCRTVETVEVAIPDNPGTDWLDTLNERKAGAA